MTAIIIKPFNDNLDFVIPTYATSGSAGADLSASLLEDVILRPQERMLIATNLSMELPNGFEAQIRSRSGLAYKHGIAVLNSPGTIDSDYRGEIKVLLINLGNENYCIKNKDRIAQMVISPVACVTFVHKNILNATTRQDGGFGSTGI